MIQVMAARRWLRLGFFRVAWLVLALLAAFVIFVECLANVGGDSDPIREPQPTLQSGE
jgi:hypothetical protein